MKPIKCVILIPNFCHGGYVEAARGIAWALDSAGLVKTGVFAMTDAPTASRLTGFPRSVEKRTEGFGTSDWSAKDMRSCFELLRGIRPRAIFCIESYKCFSLIKNFGLELREFANVYVSGFSISLAAKSRLPEVYGVTSRQLEKGVASILCDCEHVFSQLINKNYSNLTLLKNPVLESYLKPRATFSRRPPSVFRILWAARVGPVKRVHFVIKLALRFPQCEIDIAGPIDWGTKDSDFLEAVRAIPNIRYLGSFSGFRSLPYKRYNLFLHTSERDGIPHTLIEAGSVGLPILASAIGGIPELIDSNTGYLASELQDFVTAIESILAKPQEAIRRATRLQARLKKQHGFSQFQKKIVALVEA